MADISPAISVLCIAGNHDSAERLRYASSFLERHQIYISVLPPQNESEHLKKIVFQDEFGSVNIYLLPFTKPAYVRGLFPEETDISYDDAVRLLLERENINWEERNVLVSHQFYLSGSQIPITCVSEQAYYRQTTFMQNGARNRGEESEVPISVGGIDHVEARHICRFDYAALGHLHGAQWIGQKHIRYCGTPLKYSVSEAGQVKSVTAVTLREKGRAAQIETKLVVSKGEKGSRADWEG